MRYHEGRWLQVICGIALALLASGAVDRTGDEVWRIQARSTRDVEHVVNLATLYQVSTWLHLIIK